MAQAAYQTILSWDGGEAPLAVRVNRRAKRIILKIDEQGRGVIATAPSRAAVKEAVRFAGENAAWIARELAARTPARPFAPGRVFPFLGAPVRLVNEGTPRAPILLRDGALAIGGAADHVNRRTMDWLKRQARGHLTDRADHYAGLLGARRGPVRIKDMRTRWGSCASDGTIAFSWRIILAPPAIVDYVAAHECAHLIHMNHSPAYWRLVRSLGVDASGARAWFNRHGAGLFAWGAR